MFRHDYDTTATLKMAITLSSSPHLPAQDNDLTATAMDLLALALLVDRTAAAAAGITINNGHGGYGEPSALHYRLQWSKQI